MTGALLALLVPLTRWPLHTRYLYNWDAANFALGMRSFDVTLHQPHPPGYPYFVGLATLLHPLFGDANASLVAVAVLLEGIAIVATFLLGRALFSTGAGVAAALLLLGSVTFWTYGAVALAYPALAAFSTLMALYIFQTRFLGRNRLPAAAVVYGIGSGFRPDLALFLLPLLAIGCYRQPALRIVLALAIAGSGVLLWLVPAALLSGGFEAYWTALRAYTQTDVVQKYAPSALGAAALAVNVRDTAQYTFFALYFASLVVATGGLLLVWMRRYGRILFLAGWVGPVLAFYLLVHVGDPGYVFSFLPALLLAGTGGWALWLRGRGPAWEAFAPVLLVLVLTGNALVFFLHERPLTLQGLRAFDTAMEARLGYVRQLPPEEVMLVSYDSYKHFRYYLPEYPHSVWLDTKVPSTQVFPIPAGVRWALLTDPSVFALAMGLPAEAEFLRGGTWLARLPVESGQLLVYEHARLTLRRP